VIICTVVSLLIYFYRTYIVTEGFSLRPHNCVDCRHCMCHLFCCCANCHHPDWKLTMLIRLEREGKRNSNVATTQPTSSRSQHSPQNRSEPTHVNDPYIIELDEVSGRWAYYNARDDRDRHVDESYISGLPDEPPRYETLFPAGRTDMIHGVSLPTYDDVQMF